MKRGLAEQGVTLRSPGQRRRTRAGPRRFRGTAGGPSGRHGAAGEEVLGHPAAVEVVGGGLVCEDVHEEFPARDEGARDFGEEELVVFGVFCRLN